MDIVTSKDGTSIAYERSGNSRPVVLVHGTASDHNNWALVQPFLKQHFALYIVDRRGRGGSTDGPAYSVEREFEDLAALIDSIGGPVDVVGHSFGGLCAIGAAILTRCVRRLVLYEPVIPVHVSARYAPGVLDGIQALIDAGDREGAVMAFGRDILRLATAQAAQLRASPRLLESRKAAIHTVVRELRVNEGAYLAPVERLRTLTTPVLLLVGGDSPTNLHEGAETLRTVLPNYHLVTMPGQQHTAMNTAPELFAGEVIRFLS